MCVLCWKLNSQSCVNLIQLRTMTVGTAVCSVGEIMCSSSVYVFSPVGQIVDPKNVNRWGMGTERRIFKKFFWWKMWGNTHRKKKKSVNFFFSVLGMSKMLLKIKFLTFEIYSKKNLKTFKKFFQWKNWKKWVEHHCGEGDSYTVDIYIFKSFKLCK